MTLFSASLIVVAVIVLGVWLFLSVVFSVTGDWERLYSVEATRQGNISRDCVHLGQLGPLILGRSEQPGGYQTFFGVAFGPYVLLRRRDFGKRLLVNSGFPDDVCGQVEGRVMGYLWLKLGFENSLLEGNFSPYRFEFTHRPAAITGIFRMPGQRRVYKRSELIDARTPSKAPLFSEDR